MPRIAKDPDELRVAVMEACIKTFNEKGLKLTVEDVAKLCHVSKKTLYLMYADKEAMLIAAIDYCFASIKECEKEVYDDPNLSTIEKLKKIMVGMPEKLQGVDFTRSYEFKEAYPSLHKRANMHLESDWEPTIELLKKGMDEGVIRKDINIYVVKAIIESTIENFLTHPTFKKVGISYNQALADLIDIVMNGIAV
ncbi:MAG: TetR/AcrR family transcriptional regulator [Lachnospiraceae bacterium]|nr:TetR/AcrR family transcriptional regulator [Lachnospiraceae bacterium]